MVAVDVAAAESAALDIVGVVVVVVVGEVELSMWLCRDKELNGGVTRNE